MQMVMKRLLMGADLKFALYLTEEASISAMPSHP